MAKQKVTQHMLEALYGFKAGNGKKVYFTENIKEANRKLKIVIAWHPVVVGKAVPDPRPVFIRKEFVGGDYKTVYTLLEAGVKTRFEHRQDLVNWIVNND